MAHSRLRIFEGAWFAATLKIRTADKAIALADFIISLDRKELDEVMAKKAAKSRRELRREGTGRA
jgi:hypothetical protein